MKLRYVFAFRPFLDLYSSAPLERYTCSPLASWQVGAGLSVSGTATLTTSRLWGNTEEVWGNTGGANLNLYLDAGSTTTYVLPAPPGHWVPATVCEVWREACDTWDSSCQNTEASCKQDPTDNTDSCNASIDSVCKNATFNQRMPL